MYHFMKECLLELKAGTEQQVNKLAFYAQYGLVQLQGPGCTLSKGSDSLMRQLPPRSYWHIPAHLKRNILYIHGLWLLQLPELISAA